MRNFKITTKKISDSRNDKKFKSKYIKERTIVTNSIIAKTRTADHNCIKIKSRRINFNEDIVVELEEV